MLSIFCIWILKVAHNLSKQSWTLWRECLFWGPPWINLIKIENPDYIFTKVVYELGVTMNFTLKNTTLEIDEVYIPDSPF